MNKHFAGFLGAAAVLTLLAGCTPTTVRKISLLNPWLKTLRKA